MITLNNYEISVSHFPDGTQCIKFPENSTKEVNTICWFYDSDEELFTLASVVDYINRNTSHNRVIELEIPYLINSRMDRVKSPNENFSLKVFANFINSFGFDKVITHNVHSNVSEALINNIEVVSDDNLVMAAIIDSNPDVIFFPDEGACKRYADLNSVKQSNLPVAFGIKKRDWKSGQILGLDVISDVNLHGKTVLIVDDICSAGGTFKFSAMKLKDLGAKDVKLCISHCEDNIQNGELLKTDLISKIYTTDSILHIEDEKIEKVFTYRNNPLIKKNKEND